MTETLPDVLRHAGDTRDAIRALSRTMPASLPAPIASELIGDLEAACHELPLALNQIVASLTRSLSDFDMEDDDGTNPRVSVMAANLHLSLAAELADQLGDVLQQARSALAHQRYGKS
jgi:hypothetical protein